MKKHLFILFLLFAVVANTMGQSLYDQHIDAANRGDSKAQFFIAMAYLRGDGVTKDNGGMLASARGVAIKVKQSAPKGNMIVFTAAQGDETAGLYQSQQHGMFTYFLLRKLKESKGECTLGQLSEYVQTSVKRQSVVSNRKSQTPTVALSDDLADKWKNLKLK